MASLWKRSHYSLKASTSERKCWIENVTSGIAAPFPNKYHNDFNTSFSDFRSSISGKDLPEDIKNRLLNLHEENVILKEQVRTVNEKFGKAKTVSSLLKHPNEMINEACYSCSRIKTK